MSSFHTKYSSFLVQIATCSNNKAVILPVVRFIESGHVLNHEREREYNLACYYQNLDMGLIKISRSTSGYSQVPTMHWIIKTKCLLVSLYAGNNLSSYLNRIQRVPLEIGKLVAVIYLPSALPKLYLESVVYTRPLIQKQVGMQDHLSSTKFELIVTQVTNFQHSTYIPLNSNRSRSKNSGVEQVRGRLLSYIQNEKEPNLQFEIWKYIK